MKKITIALSLLVVSQLFASGKLTKIAGWNGANPKSDNAFDFIVISDRNGGALPGKWTQAITEINLLRPDFVISVGDLIDGYGTDVNELNREWDEFDELTRKLDVPFFYCPGNHDVTNQIMLDIYLKRYGVKGKSYYSFNYKKCHFIVLDSMTALRDSNFAAEQTAWLKKDISSARKAQQFFVFFHHPKMNFVHDKETNAASLWKETVSLLPKGKTTIFSGHWHHLDYFEEDSIPIHVLSSTGTDIQVKNSGGLYLENKDMGYFRMFANVSVDEDKSIISFIPLGGILPSDFSTKVRFGRGLLEHIPAYPTRDDEYTISLNNKITVPVDYVIIGAEKIAAGKLEVGQKTDIQIALGNDPSLQYSFKCPEGKNRKISLPIVKVKAAEIALNKKITVDGNLDEWANIPAVDACQEENVIWRLQNWQGRDDLSFSVQYATDGESLFAAIDVEDDVLSINDDDPWKSDAIEFYWDTRPIEKRDGKHGTGTGQMVSIVPKKGSKAKPMWFLGEQKMPETFDIAFKRTEKGYRCELQLLLKEMGIDKKPESGDFMFLEVMINDSDVIGGTAPICHMATSGKRYSSMNTHYYPISFFVGD